MITIQGQYLDQIDQAASHADLTDVLQNAVELEHATLPPYLTAMMSLKPGTNAEAREILRSVVIEEMLHMCIAANVLIALGGSPAIDVPSFIPHYPGPLPMGIADGLQVPLQAYSPMLVADVFMEIEAPEHPIPLGNEAVPGQTIGTFYDKIIAKLRALDGPPELPGDPARQVTYPGFYPAEELFEICTVADAIKGLELIIEQGEGTSTSPLDPEGDLSHYYRFEQLQRGRRLVTDATAPNGYSFTGEMIPFDATEVWPISLNTRVADLPDGSTARQMAERFSLAYSRLLHGLHRTFNGEPGYLADTLALMYDVRLIGARLAATPFPGRPGLTVGAPFEFTNVYA